MTDILTWQDVDKLVEKDILLLKETKSYDLILEPKCQAVDFQGNLIIYHYLHCDWIDYCTALWDLIQNVTDKK